MKKSPILFQKVTLNLLIFFVLLTMSSTLVLTPFIENGSLSDSSVSKDWRNTDLRTKMTEPFTDQTAFNAGDGLQVHGVLDARQYFYEILEFDSWVTKSWLLPMQRIDVYIDEIKESNKLTITGGPYKSTTGIDGTDPVGVFDKIHDDDRYGYGIEYNGTDYQEAINNHIVGYYNFTVELPDQNELSNMGISSGNVMLFEHYNGNGSFDDGWQVNNFTITLANEASLDIGNPTSATIYPDQTTDISAYLHTTTDQSDIGGIIIHYAIFDSGGTTICNSTEGPACTGQGFDVTFSTPDNLTNSIGQVTLTITPNVNPLRIGVFNLTIWPELDPNVSPYVTNTPYNSTTFTVGGRVAELTLTDPTSDPIYPDETTSITAILIANGSALNNSQLHYTLYNSTGAELCSDEGTACTDVGFIITNETGNGLTNSSGMLKFTIGTLAPAIIPEGTFNLTVWSDYVNNTSPFILNNVFESKTFTVSYRTSDADIEAVTGPYKPDDYISANITSELANGTQLTNLTVTWVITDSEGTVICTSEAPCAIFNVTATQAGSEVQYNITTNVADGEIYNGSFDGDYIFNATVNNDNSTYPYISSDPFASFGFTVDSDSQEGLLINTTRPITDIFRPGEDVSWILTTRTNTTNPYGDIPMVVSLFNDTDGRIPMANGTGGIYYVLNTGGRTDGLTGEYNISIYSNESSPLGIYAIEAYANFTEFVGPDQYVVNEYSKICYYNFTLDRLYDSVEITVLSPYPNPDQPLENGSLMFLEVSTTIIYNATWYRYAEAKYGLSSNTYTAEDLMVNASFTVATDGIAMTIDTGTYQDAPFANYYNTTSDGQIIFTILSTFPDTWENIQKNIIFSLRIDEANFEHVRYYDDDIDQYLLLQDLLVEGLTINPDYTTITIHKDTTAYNTTSDIFTLDHAMKYNFVTKDDDGGIMTGVPVRFELSTSVPGTYLYYTNGVEYDGDYILSDGSGKVTIVVNSTYGITPELETNTPVTVHAIANITEYNGGPITGPPYYIGVHHKSTNSFEDFSVTYSDVSSTANLVTTYVKSKPVFPTTTYSIRPGDTKDITITIKSGTTTITGLGIPVNASVLCSDSVNSPVACSAYGVSIAIKNVVTYPLVNPGYYRTTENGQIVFTISTTYRVAPNGIPKNFFIKVNATADFENKTTYGSFTGDERFYVGQTAVSPYNLSQSSYSTITSIDNLGKITVAPNYQYATITALTPSPTVAAPPANYTITYVVQLQDGTKLQNIRVYLNITHLDEFQASEATETFVRYTDVNGQVTFLINVTGGGLGTPDGNYTVIAIADFENDTTLAGTTIGYQWINGTYSEANQTYSIAETNTFEVKRQQTISVEILRVIDPNTQTVISSSAEFEAYRGSTLELKITYKDQDGTPINGANFELFYNGSGIIVELNESTTFTTDIDGVVIFNVTLPNSTSVRIVDGFIFADATAETIEAQSQAALEIKTNTYFSNIAINTTSTDIVRSGGAIKVTGTLYDTLSQIVSTGANYDSSVINELNGNLNVYGMFGGNPVAINSTGYLTLSGTFEIDYIIDEAYENGDIILYLEIVESGLVEHFDPLVYLLGVFQTYHYIKPFVTSISLSNDEYSQNNSVHELYAITSGFNLTISMKDNFNRILPGVNVTFNGTTTLTSSIASGGNITYQNIVLDTFQNITHIFWFTYLNGTYNGTHWVFSQSLWNFSVHRTVFDVTPPTLTVNAPSISDRDKIDQNTLVNVTTYDPGDPAVGINQNSLAVFINGTKYLDYTWNDPIYCYGRAWVGDTVTFTVNVSSYSLSTTSITIVVYIEDASGNSNQTEIIFTFDRTAPTFTSIPSPANNTYQYQDSVNISIDVVDSQNIVENVWVNITINGVETKYLMNQIDAETWQYTGFDFSVLYSLQSDAILHFWAMDRAGNAIMFPEIVYFYDDQAPLILIQEYTQSGTPVTNNSYAFNTTNTNSLISLYIADNGTGFNITSLIFYKNDTNGQTLVPHTVQYLGFAGFYSITFDTTITSDSTYYFTIRDMTGNESASIIYYLLFDDIAPTVEFGNAYVDGRIVANATSVPPSSEVIFTVEITENETQVISGSNIFYFNGNPITPNAVSDKGTINGKRVFNITVDVAIIAEGSYNYYTVSFSDVVSNVGITSAPFWLYPDNADPTVQITGALSANNSYTIPGSFQYLLIDISDGESGFDYDTTFIQLFAGDDNLGLTEDNISINPSGLTATANLSFIISQLDDNTTFTVEISDAYGNTATDYYIYLADNTKPDYVVNSLSEVNGSYLPPGTTVFVNISSSDNETGINFENTQYKINGSLTSLSFTGSAEMFTLNFTVPNLKGDTTYSVLVKDYYGNEAEIKLLFRADKFAPVITFYNASTTPTVYNSYNLVFNITDNEKLFDNSTLTITDYKGTNVTPTYLASTDTTWIYSVSLTPDTTVGAGSIQMFTISGFDYANNRGANFFNISTDTIAPSTDTLTIRNRTDTQQFDYLNLGASTDVVITGDHVIVLTYSDDGSYAIGLRRATNADLTLEFYNESTGRWDTINWQDTEKYSIITTFSNGEVLISWNNSLGDFEVEEGIYRWTIGLKDDLNHQTDVSIEYEIKYKRKTFIENMIELSTTLIATVAIFGGVGMAAGFIYEKIRYE